MTRIAIVTPYFRENRSILERCLSSVRRQSVSADHIVVADGAPQEWVDTAGVRHIRLDRNHGDFGNTPRGLGALLAIAEEYDGIGLLDADNWLEPNHVGACLAAARQKHGCDFVVARRIFRRPDGSPLPVPEEPNHIDTNCYFFLRGAFVVIPHWAMMPKRLSPSCDRYFGAMIARRPLVAARVERPTVNYLCLWSSLYKAVGETPPEGAKPNIDDHASLDWLRSLSSRDLEIASRLTGVKFTRPASHQ